MHFNVVNCFLCSCYSRSSAYVQQHMAMMSEILTYTYTCYRVVRDRGVYGDALVTYQILQSQNLTGITVSSMFVSEMGQVTFVDRQFNAELGVNVLHTGIPHFDLHYIVQLLSVSGMLILDFFSR